MSELKESFDLHRDEFKFHIAKIEERLHVDDGADDGEEDKNIKSKGTSTEDLLKNCEQMIGQMELEIRGTKDPIVKQDRKDLLQACKLQLLSYKTLEKQSRNISGGGGGKDGGKKLLWDEKTEKNYLQQAMQIQDQVGRQNSQLESSLQSIRETEQVAAEISQELGRNREKIQQSHQKVKSLNSMTEQANGLLESMSRPWYKFWGRSYQKKQ